MELQLWACAQVSAVTNTVGDLRQLMAWLDEHRVHKDMPIELGSQKIIVELSEGQAEMILCGDHKVGHELYDVLLPTHTHADTGSYTKYARAWEGLPE